MTDFVLVHGAWHGGWCWARLRPLLEGLGNRVWTPTLTGLGDRAYLAGPSVGVETHVEDLTRLIDEHRLREVVAVAHSYGGIPVTALADRCGSRLSAVIYLDSGMPQDGQSANDVFPGSDELYRANGNGAERAGLIPVPAGETFGIMSRSDLAWVQANLTPHPIKTFEDPVRLRYRPPRVPSAAIICTRDGTADTAASRSLGDMPTIFVDAGHDIMVTDPELALQALEEALRLLT